MQGSFSDYFATRVSRINWNTESDHYLTSSDKNDLGNGVGFVLKTVRSSRKIQATPAPVIHIQYTAVWHEIFAVFPAIRYFVIPGLDSIMKFIYSLFHLHLFRVYYEPI